MDPLIQLNEVSVDFTTSRNSNIVALDKVTLQVSKGEFIGIIGPSGSGKSTLLRVINGLQPVSNGLVVFENIKVSDCKKHELRALRCRIGMIFQSHQLVTRSTVIQNIKTGLYSNRPLWKVLLSSYTEQELKSINDIVHELGLDDQKHKKISQLSGGQQQRVAVARALVQKPVLLLADEPTSSLDEGRANDLLIRLKQLNKKLGLSILINLHDVDLTLKYVDRIISLKEGKVLFDDKPAELKSEIRKNLFQL